MTIQRIRFVRGLALVAGVVGWMVLAAGGVGGCGGSGGGGGGGESGSNADALANIPTVDPTALDYALAGPDGASLSGHPLLKAQEGGGITDEQALCVMDRIYANIVQNVRFFAERMFICKLRGAAALGGLSIEEDGDYYLSFAGVGGGGGDGGGGGSDEGSCEELEAGASCTPSENCSEPSTGVRSCQSTDCGSGEGCVQVSFCGEGYHCASVGGGGGPPSLKVKEQEEGGDSEGFVTKVTITTTTGSRQFDIYQCEGTTQIGYARIVEQGGLYTIHLIFRRGGSNNVEISGEIPATITLSDSAFEGSSTGRFENEDGMGAYAMIALGASHVTTISAAFEPTGVGEESGMGFAAAWNTSQGCLVAEMLPDPVCFSFEVGDDDSKTDTVLDVTSIEGIDPPDYVEVVGVSEFGTGQTWDCQVPDGASTTSFDDASAVEDAGGDRCQDMGDFWEDADSDPAGCLVE